MANKIQIRRGLRANLPSLDVGEPALCTDTKEVFIGNQGANVSLVNKETLDNHLKDYTLQVPYASASGSANAYTVALNPALASYVEGVALAVKININNTGASTININGLGAKSIKDPRGNNLTAGKLIAGSIYTLRYNGTNFILQGEGATGNATASDLLSGKKATTDAGEITGTMPIRSGDNNNLANSVAGTTLKLRAPEGYYNGAGDNVTITSANFIASNIREGINLFGITGTMPIKPDDYRGSPGSQFIVKGDSTYGYFGEVPASQLVSGSTLASNVSLTAGIEQNSDAGWLKFMYEGKILFIAKKPFRYAISWDQINARSLVFGSVTKLYGSITYKVRLIRIAVTNPYTNFGDSEYIKLMTPLVRSEASGGWGLFTNEELGVSVPGNGYNSWCQETPAEYPSWRSNFGGGAVGATGSTPSNTTENPWSWRPVLEVV